MTVFLAVIAFVVVQRLAELAYAARNTRALLAAGAVEAGRRHYPLFVLLHTSWLLAMVLMIAPETQPHWALLCVFAVLQLLRLWVLISLGRFWTTRILTLPGQPLIRTGPYRWLRHPNYVVVALEIPLLPAVFSAYGLALVFGLLNIALLAWRIHIEDQTLAPRRTRLQ